MGTHHLKAGLKQGPYTGVELSRLKLGLNVLSSYNGECHKEELFGNCAYIKGHKVEDDS